MSAWAEAGRRESREQMCARRRWNRRRRRCRHTGHVPHKSGCWCDRCGAWLTPERFPAPRENDCAYGCCKAGDVGLLSETVPA